MLDGTDPALLLEWFAYYQLEPFGEERADLRNAINCIAIMNAMGTKKKVGEWKPADFMPNFGEKKTNFMAPDAALTALQKLFPKKSK